VFIVASFIVNCFPQHLVKPNKPLSFLFVFIVTSCMTLANCIVGQLKNDEFWTLWWGTWMSVLVAMTTYLFIEQKAFNYTKMWIIQVTVTIASNLTFYFVYGNLVFIWNIFLTLLFAIALGWYVVHDLDSILTSRKKQF